MTDMKKIFNIFSAALLCVAFSFVSCENTNVDDDKKSNKPAEVTPEWPTVIEAEVLAGEIYTLNINPNVDWVLTIPETMAAYFQIQDGESQVYTLRGKAGEAEVKINTSNIEDYDLDRVCEVSLTMKGETRVIAVLTKAKKVRSLKIYAAQLEDGAYVYESDTESSLTFAYESEDMTANAFTAMFWPEGMGSYMARVKIEANFEWMVDGMPMWIQPISNGEAGVTELWLQGAPAYYPMEASSATLSFVVASNPEIVLATMDVSIPSAKEIFMLESFSVKSQFNYTGDIYNTSAEEYVEDSCGHGYLTAVDNTQICVVSFTKKAGVYSAELNPTWVEFTLGEWDSTETSLIQQRGIDYDVTENTGMERSAYLFVMPADMAATLDAICEKEGDAITGNINEAYAPYLATTIIQAEAPGSVQAADASAMLKAGAQLERLDMDSKVFTLFPEAKEAYSLIYTNNDTVKSDDVLLNLSKTISTMGYYYVPTDSDAPVQMGFSNTWLTLSATTSPTKVVMNPAKNTAILNEETGDKEGYIVLRDTEGIFAVLFCRYNEETVLVEKQEVINIEFYQPSSAASQGSTLTQLTEGELYETYYTKYNVPVFHLTYTRERTNTSMIKGLYDEENDTPYNIIYDNEEDKDWLVYEPSLEYQMVTMAPKKDASGNVLKDPRTGALVALNADESYRCVLVCTLQLK